MCQLLDQPTKAWVSGAAALKVVAGLEWLEAIEDEKCLFLTRESASRQPLLQGEPWSWVGIRRRNAVHRAMNSSADTTRSPMPWLWNDQP